MSFLRVEGAFRNTVWRDLSAYGVADAATEALAWAIQQSPLEPHEGEDDPRGSYWRAKALLYLGVIAVRASRAGMSVIADGYEQEAMGHKRTVLEAHSRMQRVMRDETGQYAREWLRGRGRKPSSAVSDFSPDDLWEMLSNSSHADFRAVENFLAVSRADGTTGLQVHPERRPEVSNATLSQFAGETRDMAVALAKERGFTIPQLEELDAAIHHHFSMIGADAEGEPPETDEQRQP